MRPLLRHRLLLLRIPQLLLRALLLLRATLLLRLRLLLRTQALLLRTLLLRLLLRHRAQASKLHSRIARAEPRLQWASKRNAVQPDVNVRRTVGKQKSHERKFVAFLFRNAHSSN
ncbi:hypothetical protein F4827_001328 [Paraburkholderia bannensis]|uniref:Uncharacterized protein n=1 Tax=Paraburkholderia bannensis TaxID=765414 RepID=A0A7W9TUE3_9BURK|nr:hypothetical protein [Paraburkholderia sp. WP4_3_2]MBB6101494.1 hypothetical protein [Paraburkholderia bannensis]